MHARIYLRRMEQPGWYYIDVFGWRPFERWQHSGWMYLSARWLWSNWR